jgi:hypothetical protein
MKRLLRIALVFAVTFLASLLLLKWIAVVRQNHIRLKN